MKKKTDSRGPQIDTEQCIKNAGGNRFDHVIIASEKLRELRRQNQHSGKYITAVDALLEVQEGKVDPLEYLAKAKDNKNKS